MTITSSLSMNTIKPEFAANSFTPGPQMLPDALHLANGGYVIAYNNHDSSDGYILLDFYDGNSNRTNSHVIAPYNTLANTSAVGTPSLTQLADGNVVVVWTNVDPGNLGTRAAIFTQRGVKVGSELTLGSGEHSDLHVEALDDGGFVTSSIYQNHIHVAVRDASALQHSYLGFTDQAAGATVSDPTCAVLANGNIVAAWSSYSAGGTIELHARILDYEGLPVSSELTLDSIGHNQRPSIAALRNGNWAIAYGDSGWGDENGSSGVSLKILTPAGANALFGTSTIHVNSPHPQADTRPSVTVLDNGFILVTWETEVSPNSFDVYGRVFTQSGTPVTINGNNGEFLISSASGNDTFPDAAALYSGRFLAAWTSTDNGGQEIAATVLEIARTTTGDGADDTITGDALRDIISSGGGGDTIDAGAGDDLIYAGAGDDWIDGGAGRDIIDGGAGNDTVIAGFGDVIDGGVGDDTVVFSQSFSKYLLFEHGSSINVSGPDGVKVTNVEHLQFADGTLDIVDDGNPLFDTPYYLSHNRDVFYAGVNALDHYNTSGWHEGRDPNGAFDTSGYLDTNPDVKATGVNPLEHYHQNGWKEGRDPGPDFDTTLYLIHNPDVAEANIDPLAHYLQYGVAEGRQTYGAIGPNIVDGFDAEFYLFWNPDVAASGVDPLTHYNTYGWHEGRNPNGLFDTSSYLSHYADVAAAGMNPLQHYEQFGWREGRDPSAGFDTTAYLAAYADVAAAGVNPLDHFLQYGVYEGRHTFGFGDL